MNVTEQIESFILSNLKPKRERKIGIEIENIFYDKYLKRIPANSDLGVSSESIINELEKRQAGDNSKSGYTLEPGGQVEWSSPPLKTIIEINKFYENHKLRMQEIIEREELKILDYSLEPKYKPSDIPLINSEKYRLMNNMFIKTGKLGKWMMRNTASVQINLDYSSKEEAEKMAYVVDCITPIASMLFANCPYWKGVPAGDLNLRYKIWSDTDNSRCGDMLGHEIRSRDGFIHNYAKYVQTVPAIFVSDKNGKVIKFSGTLGEWLLQLSKEGQLTTAEVQVALHQIFTHIRFKNVIEIRSCDKPPAGFEMAPVAFWIGLLFDDDALDIIYTIVKKWSISEREKFKKSAFVLDLNQIAPQEKTIGEWIDIITNISINGLKNRGKDYGNIEESPFLTKYITYFKNEGLPAVATQNVQKYRENPI